MQCAFVLSWGRALRAPNRAACTRRFAARAALSAEVLHLGRRSAKDGVYDEVVETLVRRMRGGLRVEERWVRGANAIGEVRKVARKVPVILLHERGRMPECSVHFSHILYDKLQAGGSRVAFVIGDDNGIPKELLEDAGSPSCPNFETLSLGPLTFTHKMVRLFFIEQLYRATEIRANSKYHR